MNLKNIKKFIFFRRKIFLLTIDFFLVLVVLFITSIKNNLNFFEALDFKRYLFLLFFGSSFAVILYFFSGQYLSLTRYTRSKEAYFLALRNFIFVLFYSIFNYFFTSEFLFFNELFIIWILLSCLTGGFRIVARDILNIVKKKNIKNSSYKNIIIYGAGSAGYELSRALVKDNVKNIISFVDDNPMLWGSYISDIIIRSPEFLSKNQSTNCVIYLAIPSLSSYERTKIIKKINRLNYKILQVPTLSEITSGKEKINLLKPVPIEEILGRDVAYTDKKMLFDAIEAKNICVTGAGGSIGSELILQILRLNPKKIILIDNSEFNLFKLTSQISKEEFNHIYYKIVLGDCCDFNFLRDIFSKESIDVVFHAAAYKHVHLVEENPIDAAKNNILSTFMLCNVVEEFSVSQMVLISTDKAVRPKSIMGLTKRMAEILVKEFSEIQINKKDKKIKFSTVRFGNVLGSSGSVVPIFRKQILSGGPITLTNKNAVRYFMTIPEAAQLVIQSSSISDGGEIFLLEMGDPVKIIDLANQMISFYGLSVKDDKNLDGDIEIIEIGLKPGEKLYEELLLDGKTLKTDHPLIFKTDEEERSNIKLIKKMGDFEKFIKNREKEKLFDLMKQIVPEYKN